jgi:hypothetical protein
VVFCARSHQIRLSAVAASAEKKERAENQCKAGAHQRLSTLNSNPINFCCVSTFTAQIKTAPFLELTESYTNSGRKPEATGVFRTFLQNPLETGFTKHVKEPLNTFVKSI